MNKRILFVGCVESSLRLLKTLINARANVVGVITKKSSSLNADYADLAYVCKENAIPFAFCFGWSQLLKEGFISLFSEGVIGFHPAALPNNKGRHPIIWALALGLTETASSFFMIDPLADHGSIISQRRIPIAYEDNAGTLYEKIMECACEQEVEFLSWIEQGTLKQHEIENQNGNSWRKRGKEDGHIDWRMSSYAIYNLVRALFHPYVGAHFTIGESEYKVWKVEEVKDSSLSNIEPGKVLRTYEDGSFDVKVYDGIIRVIDHDTCVVKEGDYL